MIDLRGKSIEIILKNQNDCGSYVACPNFDTYKYCWLRDGSYIAFSMDMSGEWDSSGRFHDWVDRVILTQSQKVSKIIEKARNNEEILNTDYLPARYMLDGSETKDEWPNFQLDGYGTWLWALCQHIKYTGRRELIEKYKNSIEITIDYLCNFWCVPNYDCWEENGDKIHTSTLSCIYGGLKEISSYPQFNRAAETAAKIKDYIEKNCVKDNRLVKYVGCDNIDASLIWAAVPFGVFDCEDEIIKSTVKEMESTILHNGGLHRYPQDTYYGGGEWLLLSCSLAWYYTAIGETCKAKPILQWVESHTDSSGEMPEQILDHVNNRDYIEKWEKLWGKVATPLLWSHAMYLIVTGNCIIY